MPSFYLLKMQIMFEREVKNKWKTKSKFLFLIKLTKEKKIVKKKIDNEIWREKTTKCFNQIKLP